MQKELAAMIGIDLPEEDIERIREADKESLLAAKNHAEYEVGRLIEMLLNKGYQMPADYLIRARKHLFSCVDRWLATGIVSPRVSSFIERMMRELARRLKRMAFGWSEDGAAKMARIIIKCFTRPTGSVLEKTPPDTRNCSTDNQEHQGSMTTTFGTIIKF